MCSLLIHSLDLQLLDYSSFGDEVRLEAPPQISCLRIREADSIYWETDRPPLRSHCLASTSSGDLQPVQGAEQLVLLVLHHMQVDHRSFDTGVAEEFLQGSNVGSILE